MTITNGYATLDQFRARLYQEGITTTIDDPVIESVIEAVSRWIDAEVGRRFYAATQTHYFTPVDTQLLIVNDLLSVTTLKTDNDGDRVYENTWASTDYDLLPYNATLYSQPQPYTMIQITPNGKYAFPRIRKGVEIAGSWGYCAAVSQPKMITEACLLQAIRLFKRKDAPFGIVGSPELGQLTALPRLDPDVKLLLHPFRRMDI